MRRRCHGDGIRGPDLRFPFCGFSVLVIIVPECRVQTGEGHHSHCSHHGRYHRSLSRRALLSGRCLFPGGGNGLLALDHHATLKRSHKVTDCSPVNLIKTYIWSPINELLRNVHKLNRLWDLKVSIFHMTSNPHPHHWWTLKDTQWHSPSQAGWGGCQ